MVVLHGFRGEGANKIVGIVVSGNGPGVGEEYGDVLIIGVCDGSINSWRAWF